jgi:hypothetical protein
MSLYLFVVSSLNHPVYREIQDKRRLLLQEYDIPYSVLMNDANRPRHTTYPPLRDDEVLFPMDGYSPSMTLKFLHATKLLFRAYPRWEDVPEYIVRINATVYLHFPSLLGYLKTLPRERVLAGPVVFHNTWFVNGMVMVFSKDVLRGMLQDPRMNEQKILDQPDDVALTQLASPHAETHDMMPYFVYGNTRSNSSREGVYRLDTIAPLHQNKWMFRIRHDASNRKADLLNWDHLMALFDGIKKESFQPGTPAVFQSVWSVVLFVVVVVLGLLMLLVLLLLIQKSA